LPCICAGPVDGPAIFNNCQSSQVTVACQQFQAKSCQDIEFGKPCNAILTVAYDTKYENDLWLLITDHIVFQQYISQNSVPESLVVLLGMQA